MNHAPPAPTVVIVAWRSGRSLPACLEALLRTAGGPPPLVLVDNACPDRSTEGAESRYPGAVVVRTGGNLGFAGGANAGIRKALEAGAEEVVLLNPDTIPEQGWMDALRSAASARKDSGILGSLLLREDGAGLDPWMERLLRFNHPDMAPGSTMTSTVPIEVGSVIGASMWMRREVLREAGGFDSLFFAYGEESDLCRRTRELGFSILLVPGSRVRHVGEGSSRGWRAKSRVRWLRCRNQGLAHLKRAKVPMRTSVLELPLRAVSLAARDVKNGDLPSAALRFLTLPAQVVRIGGAQASLREEGREWAHLGINAGVSSISGDRDLMSGATRFYRNAPQLEVVFDRVLPAVEGGSGSIRIAVHACSRGAEPYSIAIEALRRGILPRLRIDAFDRDLPALATARKGAYPRMVFEEAARRTGLPIMDPMGPGEGDLVRIPENVRTAIRFSCVDLRREDDLARLGQYEVVFCQNVLVHLEPPVEAEILRRVARFIVPGGWLVAAGRNPESSAVLDELGFEPLPDRCEEIHDAWSDRRTRHDEESAMGRTPPYWALPPFDSTAPDRDMRFGSIFRKRDGPSGKQDLPDFR